MSDQSVAVGETLSRRAYIGGLSRYITENDLKSRFGSFGVISKIDIIRDSSTGKFFEKKNVILRNVVFIFSGLTFTLGECRGLKEEWENQKTLSNLSPLVLKKRRRRNKDTMFAEDMSLVTDNNIDGRKGWKKSKYGRAVSVMRIRRNDGTKLTIDPSLYKHNLQKFLDNTIDVKPKPLDQLTYYYNDYINLSDDEKKEHQNDSSTNKNVMTSKSNNLLGIFGVKNNQNISYVKNERNAEGQNGNIPSPDKLPQSIIDGLKKLELKNKVASKQEQSNKVRLEAIKQPPEVSENFNLFDSDEEYNNNEKPTLAINPIFEGESGRERLNLQKKFRGDDRFKLTSDFVSDDENNDTDENNIVQNGDIDQVLSEEKTNQMGILKGLLGYDPKKADLKKKSLQWKEPIHFDPDAPEAKNLELDSDHEDLSESMVKSTTTPSQPLPQVSKDVKIEINADLKGMFAPSVLKAATPFSLFGGNTESEECEDVQMEVLKSDEKSLDTFKTFSKITDQTTSQGIGSASGPMFFFHFGDVALSTRLYILLVPNVNT
ncbi:33942_t:CDS:10 [Gigaspora margarita]|uniref:33942_t:CDS:1 n=1 Tax=Gigaspora margarita TaxID=4874 RepID=A0ABM8W048_GIGMA|nr:33942_t:CDS:10 [Gigaspora margarita]